MVVWLESYLPKKSLESGNMMFGFQETQEVVLVKIEDIANIVPGRSTLCVQPNFLFCSLNMMPSKTIHL